MSERQLERAMEWEAASEPLVLEHVEFPTPLFMPGTKKISIARDDNLQLKLVGEGVLTENGAFKRRRDEEDVTQPGAFYATNEVSFDAHGSQLTLKMHLEHVPSTLHTTARESTFQQLGAVYRVRRTNSQKFVFGDRADIPPLAPLGEMAWRSDWYLNGVTRLRFTRQTRRKRSATFARERAFQGIALHEPPGGDAGAWDHLVVDAGGVRFAYCRVPDDCAPEGLNAISIDFLAPSPNEQTRAAVAEIISFVLGRRLLPLGSTTFDGTGWTIEEESVNPWATNVRDLCRTPDLPPVAYDSDGRALEALLTGLVPRYLAARESLGLHDALWSYWIAKESPASIDLPIFSSAVEALKRNWLASAKSKSKGVHLPKDEFERLAGDLIEELRKRVREKKLPEELARNFAGANRMGLGAQMRAFLKEIDIPIGEREQAAMDARHQSAHGAGGGEELTQLVRLGNAYRTLFERVFLRLLGHEGTYVDRATEGWPEQLLGEPAGGRSPAAQHEPPPG